MAKLEELKTKYAPALHKIEELGVSLQNLHVQDNKLFIKGAAPSEAAKGEVWTAIKSVDWTFGDLTADITIDPNLPQPKPKEQSYIVKSGDTLAKISKQFYGDANYIMPERESTSAESTPAESTPTDDQLLAIALTALSETADMARGIALSMSRVNEMMLLLEARYQSAVAASGDNSGRQ